MSDGPFRKTQSGTDFAKTAQLRGIGRPIPPCLSRWPSFFRNGLKVTITKRCVSFGWRCESARLEPAPNVLTAPVLRCAVRDRAPGLWATPAQPRVALAPTMPMPIFVLVEPVIRRRSSQQPAVDRDDRPSDVLGGRAREECHHFGDVGGFAEAAKRDQAALIVAAFPVRGVHIGIGRARLH